MQLHRLSSKFLLLTVPAVALSALLFVLASFVLRVAEREKINQQLAVQQARGHASLLGYPMWNLDGQTVEAILQSMLAAPGVHCVQLEPVAGLDTLPPLGRCERREQDWEITTAIEHVDRSGTHPVGVLHHWVDVSVGRAEVWRDLGPLLLQLLLLLAVLILCSLIAFSRTVRRPLAQVADSLRAFRERGEREPVRWQSVDELGEFIREYNAGLQRQELAERNLQAQLNFQMALHQTMPTPFAYLEANLRLYDANPAFHSQLGIGAEALGQSMPGLLPSVDWAAILALSAGEVHSQELLGIALRGREHGFSLACSPFLDHEGEIKGYVLVLQDITDRLENEAALREAMARSEATLAELHRTQASLLQSEKLASLGSLVAGIAHEINTPLGSSLTVASRLSDLVEQLSAGFAERALRRSEMVEFLQQAGEGCSILQSSLQAANEQVRRFKQVAVDQVGATRRQFDLLEVVAAVVAAQRPRTQSGSHRIEVSVPGHVLLDSLPGPLEQVLDHCISNALIHGLEGQDDGHVQVRAQPLGPDWVRIEVADNGRGMSAEHLRRVFDPFFTTRFGHGGSGLGMSQAYQLVSDVLHGRISVESQLGQGTRVRIDLPLRVDQEMLRTSSARAGAAGKPML